MRGILSSGNLRLMRTGRLYFFERKRRAPAKMKRPTTPRRAAATPRVSVCRSFCYVEDILTSYDEARMTLTSGIISHASTFRVVGRIRSDYQ